MTIAEQLASQNSTTPTAGDSSTKIATTAFVQGELTSVAKVGTANAFTSGSYCSEKALPATTGTVTLDLSSGVNFGGQLTGSITLANPTGMQPGQSGVIRIVNGATSAYTIIYGSYWKASSGAMPSLTATIGATDLFAYYVNTSTSITLVQQADIK